MKRLLLFSFLLSAVVIPRSTESAMDAHLLQQILRQEYHDIQGGILMLRLSNGEILASVQIQEFFRPYPPGSLVKVFTTISYARTHGEHFPRLRCPPSLPTDRDGCWDRNGHGDVGIIRALANSCNVYFRQLAQDTDPRSFASTLKDYQLIQDSFEILSRSEEMQRKLMVGNTNEWSIPPIKMLRAYCAIFNGGILFGMQDTQPSEGKILNVLLPESSYRTIHSAMELSSLKGTSMEAKKIAGVPVLGKTGTTLTWNDGRTDWKQTHGWWIGLYPVSSPEVAIMVSVHGGRGATDAAPIGGKVLAAYIRLTEGRNEFISSSARQKAGIDK